jgi:hypothetical protein
MLVLSLVTWIATNNYAYSQSYKITSFEIISSDTNKSMGFLKDGQTINIATLPSRNFSIRANTYPSTVGSVRFQLDLNTHFSIENQFPYTLTGDSSKLYPIAWNPSSKEYYLEATPYTKPKGSGSKGTPLAVKFKVIDEVPPKIVSLTLINTDNNQAIGVLKDGDILNLATMPSRNISIRADTQPSITGSVLFGYDNNSSYHLEGLVPYSISGDDNGILSPWPTPSLGEHLVSATPYSESKTSGIKGDTFSIKFKVIDQPPLTLKVNSLTLINADTNQPIGQLFDGMELNLATLPTKNLSVRADADAEVKSVRFSYDGEENYQIESYLPYALKGDVNGISYNPWTPSEGNHTLIVTPYSESKANGINGQPLTVHFKVKTEVSLPPHAIPLDLLENGVVPRPNDLAVITGNEFIVNTKQEFLEAIKVVGPGDGILINGGEKHDWGSITVSASGEATKPVIIRSKGSPVIFKGIFALTITGSYVHLQGLSFFGTTEGVKIGSPSEGTRASLMYFKDIAKYSWAAYQGTKHSRIDHSLAEGSRYKTLYIDKRSFGVRIDHNFLRNTYLDVVNGGEAIQVGTSAFGEVEDMTKYYTNALIDHNILQRMEGEGEMIGIKSDGNKIVFNVIVDSNKGHLSYRSGHYNLVFGNVFRKTKGGTRIFGVGQKFMHNLIIDPISYGGVFLPAGSDKSYPYNNTTFVRYIAARKSLVLNNSVIITQSSTGTSRAIAEIIPSYNCGPDSSYPCDLKAFSNHFGKNLIVNRKGSSTFNFSSEFASNNSFSSNLYDGSSDATFSVPSSISPGFIRGSLSEVSPHEALANFVLSAPQDGKCLQLTTPKHFDSMLGVSFSEGKCVPSHLDNGSYWLNLNLMSGDIPLSDSALNAWIKGMPIMYLPVIPPQQ